MPGVSTSAFVLRAVDLRESDRLLTLLTEKLGKVSAVARGARTSRKRFGGALEPFALIEVLLERGRGRESLFAMTEASLKDAHEGLSRDLERLGAAAFIVELAREVTPEHEPDAALFRTVATSLSILSTAKTCATRPFAVAVGLGILTSAGFAVSADRCNACGKPVPENRKACFDPRRGGVVCTACGGGPLLLSAEAAASLAALGHVPLVEASRAEISGGAILEIETALSAFLEQHLPHLLRSAHFRRQVGPTGM